MRLPQLHLHGGKKSIHVLKSWLQMFCTHCYLLRTFYYSLTPKLPLPGSFFESGHSRYFEQNSSFPDIPLDFLLLFIRFRADDGRQLEVAPSDQVVTKSLSVGLLFRCRHMQCNWWWIASHFERHLVVTVSQVTWEISIDYPSVFKQMFHLKKLSGCLFQMIAFRVRIVLLRRMCKLDPSL